VAGSLPLILVKSGSSSKLPGTSFFYLFFCSLLLLRIWSGLPSSFFSNAGIVVEMRLFIL